MIREINIKMIFNINDVDIKKNNILLTPTEKVVKNIKKELYSTYGDDEGLTDIIVDCYDCNN